MSVPVFPSVTTLPGITYPVKSTLQWDTVKHDAISGKRVRYPNWTYPLRKWSLPISTLRTDAAYLEWQTLIGFINSVQGAAQLFAYDDPLDDSVTAQSFGVGDGATMAFQLVRTFGGFTEPVFLLNGTPQIFVNAILTTPASISAYGVVNFSGPPAPSAALTWTGNFYFPARFDDDNTDLEKFVFNMYEAKALAFSSEKLP